MMIILGVLGVVGNILSFSIFGIILSGFVLAVAVLLYIGVTKENSWFIKLYLVVEAIGILLTVIDLIVEIFSASFGAGLIWSLLFSEFTGRNLKNQSYVFLFFSSSPDLLLGGCFLLLPEDDWRHRRGRRPLHRAPNRHAEPGLASKGREQEKRKTKIRERKKNNDESPMPGNHRHIFLCFAPSVHPRTARCIYKSLYHCRYRINEVFYA